MSQVHIYAPPGYYIGQVRRYGHRKWETVGDQKHASDISAMVSAVMAMTEHHKRARAIFITEWHEPNIAMEASR